MQGVPFQLAAGVPFQLAIAWRTTTDEQFRFRGSAALFEGLDESTFLTLAQAASLLPGRRPGKRKSVRVIRRWVVHGVRGQRLKTIRIVRRHVVCVADLRDFLDAIAPKSSWPERVPNPRLTERQRVRRAEMMHRAAAFLLGVLEKGR